MAKAAGYVHHSTGDIVIDKELLEACFGKVWTREEAKKEFKFKVFLPPYALVARLSDGVKGTLEFQKEPRLYFNFQEDS